MDWVKKRTLALKTYCFITLQVNILSSIQMNPPPTPVTHVFTHPVQDLEAGEVRVEVCVVRRLGPVLPTEGIPRDVELHQVSQSREEQLETRRKGLIHGDSRYYTRIAGHTRE